MSFRSWGGLPEQPLAQVTPGWRDELVGAKPAGGLVVGNGRSYGDVCLGEGDVVTSCRGLDCITSFDRESGRIRCEAGVTLGQLLALVLPAGWCLPVVPGTQHVTVGGAIANDIHGKNHHRRGTFGCHLRGLTLARSDGEVVDCSPEANVEWFEATVGGLGLTGVILDADIQLLPVSGPCLETETIRFESLSEFFALSRESDESHEHCAAWIDCLSPDTRGYLSRANVAQEPAGFVATRPLLSVPFHTPVSPVNRFTLRLFNALVYHRQPRRPARRRQDFMSWNFPLDRVQHWNRLYGRAGFRQYQCVVPETAVGELLQCIRRSGQGSFLAVLKTFGSVVSPGLLSFPRPGVTLALDFPWRGERTLALFRQLEAIVDDCDGAIYPAKDAHMSAGSFRRAYPRWQALEAKRDPALNSRFWRRVSEGEA